MIKRLLMTGMLATGAGAALAGTLPGVSGVGISQDGETRLVTVVYTLSADAVVTASFETNVTGDVWAPIGGEHQWLMSGDVNRLVAAGDGTFIWQPSKKNSWAGHLLEENRLRVVVTAWDPDNPPLYMAADLRMKNRVLYYPDEASVPGGVQDRIYKTAYLLMRKVPAANVTWTMGSFRERVEGTPPLHRVRLTENFYLGVYELTQRQWFNVTGTTNTFIVGNTANTLYRATTADHADHEVCPMDHFRWVDLRGTDKGRKWPLGDDPYAVDDGSFIAKLRDHTGLQFDLPTETQWEFAARAGTMTSYCYGSDEPLEEYGALASGGAKGPVGSCKPNRWGFYDINGNTVELCLDNFSTTKKDASVVYVDPMGSETDNKGNSPETIAADVSLIRLARSANSTWGADKQPRFLTSYRYSTMGDLVRDGYGVRLYAPASAR